MIHSDLSQKNQKKLEEEKQHLEQLLSRVAKRDKVGGDFHATYPDVGSTEDDNAMEVAMYETNIAEEHDLEDRLNKVIAALRRIENGTYGICAVGGEAIPLERLEVAPEAETCIEHATP